MNQSLLDLKAKIAALPKEKQNALLQRLKANQQQKSYPLSYAQERFWFTHEFETEMAVCNIPVVMRLSGPVNIPILERSLQLVIERHDPLRTYFTKKDEIKQCVLPKVDFSIDIEDLSSHSSDEGEDNAKKIIDQFLKLPFDLEKAPLLYAKLIKLDTQRYIFALSVHHIILEGWSLGLLSQELIAHYQSITKTGEASFTPLSYCYEDYVRAQRKEAESGSYNKELDYWKKQLSGISDHLAIPTDFPRPNFRTSYGATRNFTFNQKLSKALNQLCRERGLTMNMVIVAAVNVLLFRYTNQSDIVLGGTLGNRKHIETEPLIGLIFNMIVLRSDLSRDPTIIEVLKRVRNTVLSALENSEIPFELIVKEINPKRDNRFTPIFQVLLSHNNAPLEKWTVEDVEFDPVLHPVDRVHTDLTILFSHTHEALTELRIEYSTDLFTDEFACRFMGHLENILSYFIHSPDLPISQIGLLSQAEKQMIIEQFNEAPSLTPPKRCLHQLFEEMAVKQPQHSALIQDGSSMTYEELNQKSNQLAHYLKQKGVEKENIVGVMMPVSFDMIISILGILKAGAAYLPLDIYLPDERLAFLLGDTQSVMVLSSETRQFSIPFLSIDDIQLDQYPDHDLDIEYTPNDLAYCIYTSGSTGKPKGVLIEHRSALNTIFPLNQLYHVQPSDRFFSISNITFDLSVYDIFGSLSAGATMVLPNADFKKDPLHWLELLQAHKVTIWNSVPLIMQMLLDAISPKDSELCPALRLGFFAGDWIPLEQPNEIRRKLNSHVKLVGLGGTTENSIYSNYYPIEKQDPNWRSIPYGKPLPNQTLYVLDQHLQPVPIGVTGEIYIGGDGVGRGYQNLPDPTNERFISDPFSASGDGRMYKTGDLGRHFADGNIEFLGRADSQVKIRGIRTELKEIEVTLENHPAIRQAAVVLKQDQLIAYLVLVQGREEDFKEYLKSKLPEHMVPSSFVILDRLPLNQNDKVDRKALMQFDVQKVPLQKECKKDWFYQPEWNISEEQPSDLEISFQRVILLKGREDEFESLSKTLLSTVCELIVVSQGNEFRKINATEFTVRFDDANDYERLLEEIGSFSIPTTLVHGVTYTDEDNNQGLMSVIALAQALGNLGIQEPLTLRVITKNIHKIFHNDRVYPLRAMLQGVCQVIPQEYPSVACQIIEIDHCSTDILLEELKRKVTQPLVAFREGKRFVRTFVPIENPSQKGQTRFQANGVYLLTGGLGGIGSVIARHLATTVQAKLILVHHESLPKKNEWSNAVKDPKVSEKVKKRLKHLLELEELGAEVIVWQADVSDRQRMEEVIQFSEKRFGKIQGVMHLAGISPPNIIQLLTQEKVQSVLAPKVMGTEILYQLLKDHKLDFFLLFSSMTSILGGVGSCAYSAANHYLDAFANRYSGEHQNITTINWGVWKDVGMTTEAKVADSLKSAHQSMLENGISDRVGMDMLEDIVTFSKPQVLANAIDLPTMINCPDYTQSLEEYLNVDQKNESVQIDPDIHEKAKSIWELLLHVDDLKPESNFFECGGHSILATQLINRINKAFHVKLRLRDLFESPTLAEMCALIAKKSF